MLAEPVDRARLKRIANYGELTCIAVFLLVCGYCLYLILQPEEAVAVLQRDVPGTLVRPGNAALVMAGVFALMPIAIFLVALWHTRSLFQLIGGGQFLSEKSQSLFGRVGKLALVWAVLGIVCRTIVVLFMTSANPVNERQLLIEIDSGQISSVLVAILFFTFSLLLKESAAIEEENRHII